MRGRSPASCAWAIAAATLGCPACAAGIASLGETPALARSHADDLATAFAWGLGPVEREPALAVLRPKIARAALVPSRVFGDASVWTADQGREKTLEIVGRHEAGRYRLGARASAGAPADLGDYQGVLRLRRLRSGEYEWTRHDGLALGSVTGADFSRALTALFRAAEESTESDALARTRDAFPRTRAVLGRLLTLGTLRPSLLPSGAMALDLEVVVAPKGLEGEAPRFASYLGKYLGPMRFNISVEDGSGARWCDLRFEKGRLGLRLAVGGGDLAPLDGPRRRIPDETHARASFATKMGPFGVGLRDLRADITLGRTARERQLAARFLREPDWDLPFLVEPLLRGSLRRPFEGEGAFLAVGIRDGAPGPTLVYRDYRMAVRESWIVRWLGGMMSGAVNEFRLGAEAEADRFIAEVFLAIRADALAILDSEPLPKHSST